MTKKKIFLLLLLTAAAILVSPICSYARDEDGGGGNDHIIDIYIYNDYYIPYVPGMDNCYGSYRLLGTRGYQSRNYIGASRSTKVGGLLKIRKDIPSQINDYVGYYDDWRTVNRDDVIVMTEFNSVASYMIKEDFLAGRYHYFITHAYYFEIPKVFAGMTADMNPIYGSQAADFIERPWTITLDRNIIAKYMPSFTPIQLCPNFNKQMPKYKVPGVSYPSGYNFMYGTRGNIVKSANVSGSSKTRLSGGSYYYKHIASLTPDNAQNVDLIGWWDEFSLETLSNIDNMRKNLRTDEKQPFDTDNLSSLNNDPDLKNQKKDVGLDAALNTKWGNTDIYFSADTFHDYTYRTAVLAARGTSNVWNMRKIYSQKEISDSWYKASENIFNEAVKLKKLVLPWDANKNALYSLESSTAGLWTPPHADLMENQSMYINMAESVTLGHFPFARAQTNLYYEKYASAPTILGYKKAFDSMSAFLGIKVTRETDYINMFRSKVFSLYSGWTNPWLPTAKDDNTIWNYWYKKDNNLYTALVPSLNMEQGMTLWEMNDSTSWNIGIERQRNPQVIYNRSNVLNGYSQFPSSILAQYKSRGWSDADAVTYRMPDGRVLENKVPYVSGFKQTPPNTDFGNVSLRGDNSMQYIAYVKARYFPFEVSKIPSLKNRFSMLGTEVIPVDYAVTGHYGIWQLFKKETPEKRGIGLIPPKWN